LYQHIQQVFVAQMITKKEARGLGNKLTS
jgi:hypothetical protein